MQDGPTDHVTAAPAPPPVPLAAQAVEPPPAKPDRTLARRPAWPLVVVGGVGMVLGVLLTLSLPFTVSYFTHSPLTSPAESVRVFNELNELRQQVNQVNADQKLKEKKDAETVRQALSEVASVAAGPPPDNKGKAASARPTKKAHGDFAEVDAEIERLERTQKTLNTILDLFTPKGKEERPKDR